MPPSRTPSVASKAASGARADADRALVMDAIRSRLNHVLSGISARSIAKATGHNHESIRRYRRSCRVPADFLYAVCVAYGISPTGLLLGLGTPTARGKRVDTAVPAAVQGQAQSGSTPLIEAAPSSWKLHGTPNRGHPRSAHA